MTHRKTPKATVRTSTRKQERRAPEDDSRPTVTFAIDCITGAVVGHHVGHVR
ncbi:MAG: hypothetical protein J0J06_03740 [Sphingomonas sp.]|uniref:hypothetical protein n=1 Tax=Sphingomonas sp. TaxID=28214 RepID=UPI001ACCBF10|nr:hypothetical protein [Sphingomonas sp.]MBN8814544.1 hypothetical protein [Sphingomonas sp.]